MRQVVDESQVVEDLKGKESRSRGVTCSGPMDGDWVSAKWFINGNALDSFSEEPGVSLVH